MNARFTIYIKYMPKNVMQGFTHVPGNKANIFGSVLPIQKGTWNWEMVRRVYHMLVGRPKRVDTARRRREREKGV